MQSRFVGVLCWWNGAVEARGAQAADKVVLTVDGPDVMMSPSFSVNIPRSQRDAEVGLRRIGFSVTGFGLARNTPL